MTSAQDVIDSYVADAAGLLPLRQRMDIGRELQGLLHDELQARAEREGKSADEAMARAVVAAFGSASDVAAGYRTGGLMIIPPEQSARFIKAAVAGVAIQWAIGIADAIVQVNAGASESIIAQRWFFTWGLGAFWWPGFMVVCAAVAAREATGIAQVALTGGCMHNRRLARQLRAGLERKGFAVYQHRNVSPGDGGLSYGQAVVAAAMQNRDQGRGIRDQD